jgi:Leucine-rich repeat (LRR) protein
MFPLRCKINFILFFINIKFILKIKIFNSFRWMCASLETLDLSRNKISLVVPDIGNLQNLLYINLSQCNLTTLPNEIGFCAELKEIILMGNQIESLPDSLKECDNLEVLRLSYRNFSTMLDSYMDNLIFKGQIKSEHIPPVVFDLAKMTNLDLKHTKINTIPDNNLCGMLELNLDFNYISTLAENSMKSMTNIRILTLSNNFLNEIPAEINNLLSLEVLDLSCNTITEITNNSNLKNLKELNLSSNRLNGVNDNIKYFKGLQKLRLEKNAISELSEELYELDMLFYLDLCYNRIIRLSEKLVRLKSLKLAHSYIKLERTGLWLIGNPLKIPSSDYWSTTHMEKMHNYLSSYIQRNLDYVFYSKLVFIGLPNTGKSSLIDSFYHIVEKDEQSLF